LLASVSAIAKRELGKELNRDDLALSFQDFFKGGEIQALRNPTKLQDFVHLTPESYRQVIAL
jgi:hypothetical protein